MIKELLRERELNSNDSLDYDDPRLVFFSGGFSCAIQDLFFNNSSYLCGWLLDYKISYLQRCNEWD